MASDKPLLSPFIHSEVIKNESEAIKAPFGYGKVNQTGIIAAKKLISDYRNYLKIKTRLEISLLSTKILYLMMM